MLLGGAEGIATLQSLLVSPSLLLQHALSKACFDARGDGSPNWYVSDYDCDWDQENDRWLMTSRHRALLAPIAQRKYDDLRKRLSDPKFDGIEVEKAMAEDTEMAGDLAQEAATEKCETGGRQASARHNGKAEGRQSGSSCLLYLR